MRIVAEKLVRRGAIPAILTILFSSGVCGRAFAAKAIDVSPPITELSIYLPKYIGPDGAITITTATPLLVMALDQEVGAVISLIDFIGMSIDREAASIRELNSSTSAFTLPLGRHMIWYGSSDNAGNVDAVRSSTVSVISLEEFTRNYNPTPQMGNLNIIEATDQRRKRGPARLTENKRRQLIALLDWNSLVVGQDALRCNDPDFFTFVGKGPSIGLSIGVRPHCEYVSFGARVGTGRSAWKVWAAGLMPGSRKKWKILVEDLFPDESQGKAPN